MFVRKNPWVAVAALVFVACGSVAQPPPPSTTSTTFEAEVSEVTIAEPFDGLVEVASITDGDTFRVLSADGANEPVRMIGIDAPDRGDPMWEEASARLSLLIVSERSFSSAISPIVIASGGCSATSMSATFL